MGEVERLEELAWSAPQERNWRMRLRQVSQHRQHKWGKGAEKHLAPVDLRAVSEIRFVSGCSFPFWQQNHQ